MTVYLILCFAKCAVDWFSSIYSKIGRNVTVLCCCCCVIVVLLCCGCSINFPVILVAVDMKIRGGIRLVEIKPSDMRTKMAVFWEWDGSSVTWQTFWLYFMITSKLQCIVHCLMFGYSHLLIWYKIKFVSYILMSKNDPIVFSNGMEIRCAGTHSLKSPYKHIYNVIGSQKMCTSDFLANLNFYTKL